MPLHCPTVRAATEFDPAGPLIAVAVAIVLALVAVALLQARPGSGVRRSCRRVAAAFGVGDGLSQLFDLAGLVVGGERCAVLSVGDAVEVVGQAGTGQLVAEECVDRVGDGVLAEVERGWVADLVLADESRLAVHR